MCLLSFTGVGRTGKGRTNQSNSVLEDAFLVVSKRVWYQRDCEGRNCWKIIRNHESVRMLVWHFVPMTRRYYPLHSWNIDTNVYQTFLFLVFKDWFDMFVALTLEIDPESWCLSINLCLLMGWLCLLWLYIVVGWFTFHLRALLQILTLIISGVII